MLAAQSKPLALADAPILTPQYRALSFEDAGDALRLTLECSVPLRTCPHCGGDISPWGRQRQTFKDLPRRGKPVDVVVSTRRYRCKSDACRKTSTQRLPAMSVDRMMTQRLVRWIGEQGVRRSFVSIAAEVGVNEKTVRAVFSGYCRELRSMVRIRAGTSMAVLDVPVMGSRRYVILNTDSRIISDLVEDRSGAAVSEALEELAQRQSVARVAIGFDQRVLDAVHSALPQAVAYVDPVFVQELLHQGLDAVRSQCRLDLSPVELRSMSGDTRVLRAPLPGLDEPDLGRLRAWKERTPLLGESHDFKEVVMGLYRGQGAQSAHEGACRIDEAVSSLSPACAALFGTFIERWASWRQHIAAGLNPEFRGSFVLGITTVRELAGLLDSFGREYSIAALRAKLRCPSGIHSVSLTSPGTGIARLRVSRGATA